MEEKLDLWALPKGELIERIRVLELHVEGLRKQNKILEDIIDEVNRRGV